MPGWSSTPCGRPGAKGRTTGPCSPRTSFCPFRTNGLRGAAGHRRPSLTSTHFGRVGERTREPGGAHVEPVRSAGNPVGVKLGPEAMPWDVLDLLTKSRSVPVMLRENKKFTEVVPERRMAGWTSSGDDT
ncbi:3-deoxy-7-phosphoheptulonate synthase [Streptomyces sp. C11-1]|uniref:Phospho-2-dehydro-3-deoxyheptonate aldolase n=1 Tax=Streptomyces durocortorensis TaxID=2811104 RepID=A0ABY9W4C0_9ACTN|nr:3-deoxy-7-phosphoheptulonate synthase [Streptomyces durocortorensis]WNF30838.1 3-deoxy-7-phosphoheptulonate synthase [Streptomyces durocortorensis]